VTDGALEHRDAGGALPIPARPRELAWIPVPLNVWSGDDGDGRRYGIAEETMMERTKHNSWRRANVIAGAIFILIGLGVLVSAFFAASGDARLQAEGTTLTADLVDARQVQRTRRGATVATEYEVKYRFIAGGSLAAGGSVILSDWMDAPEAVAREAARVGTIEVRYLPGEPAVNKPVASLGAGVGGFSFPIGQLVAGALFAGVGGLIVFSGRPTAVRGRPGGGPSPAMPPM
jgi:hypothetical protein